MARWPAAQVVQAVDAAAAQSAQPAAGKPAVRSNSVGALSVLAAGSWVFGTVAEAHGGRAGVRSAYGEGATFLLELPVSP